MGATCCSLSSRVDIGAGAEAQPPPLSSKHAARKGPTVANRLELGRGCKTTYSNDCAPDTADADGCNPATCKAWSKACSPQVTDKLLQLVGVHTCTSMKAGGARMNMLV